MSAYLGQLTLEVQGAMLRNNAMLLDMLEDDETPKNSARQRQLWVRSWLMERPSYGQYHQLMAKMEQEDIAGNPQGIRRTR